MLSTPREPRYPYRGRVRLLLPFAPWGVLLTLDGADLSQSGLRATLPLAARIGEGIEPFLVEGQAYELQLEHEAEHLPIPLLRGRLVRRKRHHAGWELAFAFASPDHELRSLVHEFSCSHPHSS